MSSEVTDWVWLARIRRPQGRKGEVFAEILTDFPEKFAERKRLWLLAESASAEPVRGQNSAQGLKPAPSKPAAYGTTEVMPFRESTSRAGHSGIEAAPPREVELVHHWLHKSGVVLHFAGVDSISAAETLAGLIVAIPQSERAALAEDEVYIGDLIGCTLVDVAVEPPVAIGEIEDVDRAAGPTPLLVVKGAKGEVLVPFAKSYLRKVDVENKRVEMALPAGLADLNG
jgi:16S rRNA processing protein RimM